MARARKRHETPTIKRSTRLAQLDAFVRAGYQRLEALNVPVFAIGGSEKPKLPKLVTRDANLLRLPTVLPREILTVEQWLAGDSCDELDEIRKLSLLLRYLSAPIRIEPHAESLVHRAVPSARMLCPVRYIVLQRSSTGIHAYRYEPAFHALESIGMLSGTGTAFAGEIAIGCIASPAEIAPLYGDFSTFPSVLEAGHGFAQLGQLARMLGLVVNGSANREALRSKTQSHDELPLFVVPLALNLDAIDQLLPDESVRLAERPRPAPIAAGSSAAVAIFNSFDDGAAPISYAKPKHVDAAPGAEELGPGALATLRARSSGNDRSGIAARLDRFEPGLFDRLLTCFARMLALRTRLPGESAIQINLACLRADLAPVGIYDLTGHRRHEPQSALDFVTRAARMLPYRGMRYNLATLAVSLLVTTDPVKAIDRLGGAALREIHLAAGAVAQDFGNAAGSLGLFARPMRMMRESTLERALPLDGQLVYQALCGRSRRANLAFDLA